MTTLIATSVVRGSNQGESHGGVYLIDLDKQDVRQVIDWNRSDIDWSGRGWDRGLRGIAFDGDTVYIAASDELFAYTTRFQPLGSWRNPYLKHCHEIAIQGRRLFLSSTGFDAVLGFDLDRGLFDWGLRVEGNGPTLATRLFDPRAAAGPPARNTLHLNNVYCDQSGLYIGGLRTGGLLRFDGRRIGVVAELPEGSHNARPFSDGVLFNDTEADALRYCSRTDPGSDRALAVPAYPREDLQQLDADASGIARPGFGRGLCVCPGELIAGGSSPSTVTLYDLAANQRVLAVNLSMDVRNAIHGLAVWPYQ